MLGSTQAAGTVTTAFSLGLKDTVVHLMLRIFMMFFPNEGLTRILEQIRMQNVPLQASTKVMKALKLNDKAIAKALHMNKE